MTTPTSEETDDNSDDATESDTDAGGSDSKATSLMAAAMVAADTKNDYETRRNTRRPIPTSDYKNGCARGAYKTGIERTHSIPLVMIDARKAISSKSAVSPKSVNRSVQPSPIDMEELLENDVNWIGLAGAEDEEDGVVDLGMLSRSN